MPRDLPVGNGNLLVTFDRDYRFRDFYFPRVGQENHTEDAVCRFGVWVEGRFAWVGPEWQCDLKYEPDTLVTAVTCRHPGLELELACTDGVDFYENVYLKRVAVRNLAARRRQVRLFFSHDFNLYGTRVGDTVFYDPETRSVIHYKARRNILMNGCDAQGGGIREFACGEKGIHGLEGTWRDAEDGTLAGSPIAQGSVDSTIALFLDLEPRGQGVVYHWIAAGRAYQEVRRLNSLVRDKTPEHLLRRTADYWRLWANKEEYNLDGLPPETVFLFKRSQLILRTQIDNRGAILAANDSDFIRINHDTYSYCWPRDGALAAHALIKAGHSGISRRFFDFCGGIIHPRGYFLHKYNPDGSLASSWHSWMTDHTARLPIQEDETALVLWAFWRHFEKFRDIEFIAGHYRPMIVSAAEFLAGHTDPETGLPLPSYDLWEERWGVHTWTVATVIAALRDAARFAEAFGETDLAARYGGAAERMTRAYVERFWSDADGRFARSATAADGRLRLDVTADASLAGLVLFGVLDPCDPKVQATLRAVRERLTVRTAVGGIARYEGDMWHRVVPDRARVPGNPWFVSTLWMMRCEIAQARTLDQLDRTLHWLQWVARWALASGVLAEQLHPETGEPLGVSPLSWSHAELITAVVEFLERRAILHEEAGRIWHLHQRGRYADRYTAPHCWETPESTHQRTAMRKTGPPKDDRPARRGE